MSLQNYRSPSKTFQVSQSSLKKLKTLSYAKSKNANKNSVNNNPQKQSGPNIKYFSHYFHNPPNHNLAPSSTFILNKQKTSQLQSFHHLSKSRSGLGSQAGSKRGSKQTIIQKKKTTIWQQPSKPNSKHLFDTNKHTDKHFLAQNQNKYHLKQQKSRHYPSPLTSDKHSKTINYNVVMPLADYSMTRQQMKLASSKKNQKQATVFELCRKAGQTKKEQSSAKDLLIRALQKKVDSQQRQKLKQQHRQKEQEWLRRQRNLNATRKYMNSFVKYHEKIALTDRNKKQADDLKELKRSMSSKLSLRSNASQKSLQQNASRIRQQSKRNLQKAKAMTSSQINTKSNSVRQEKKSNYIAKTSHQLHEIERLDSMQYKLSCIMDVTQRSKFAYEDILKNVDEYNSKDLYNALRQKLIAKSHKQRLSRQRQMLRQRQSQLQRKSQHGINNTSQIKGKSSLGNSISSKNSRVNRNAQKKGYISRASSLVLNKSQILDEKQATKPLKKNYNDSIYNRNVYRSKKTDLADF